ncbi:MAG: Cys-tRNA(Pro) deacylase [Acidobacteria bacterium]|nr:MAG: Cys-tRNA(Pro) deacylase [Acidobacteriota bacterium]RLE24414.1 MAG: Cys-tRNA(Pro) deacylase [Acidobacteriota bacterium]
MKTRGITYLEQFHFPFEVYTYRHDKKGAEFAAKATGVPLERMIKTLVVGDTTRTRYFFILMPGHLELDLKKAAAAAGVKRLRMASVSEAERLTGYQVGGISPFGSRKELPVLMEEDIKRHISIAINGGGRGCIVALKTEKLIELLKPEILPLAQNEES